MTKITIGDLLDDILFLIFAGGLWRLSFVYTTMRHEEGEMFQCFA